MATRKRKRIKIVKPFQFYSLLLGLLAALALIIFLIVKLIGAISGGDGQENSTSVDSKPVESILVESKPAESSKVTAPADTTPPAIKCADSRTVYLGDAVSYKKDVTVSDDTDAAPTLEVDSSNVNLRKAGTYTYTLTATDSAGNKATRTVTLTVKEKVKEHVTEAEMYAEADKVIAKIITDDMTPEQQVKAIYNWARGNIGYINHSDKTDWVQTAYKTFVNRQSDCFGYFAVTKALLNRLGIENKDIIKVKLKEGASSHYWSLVTLDGTNWYHLDTTPRKGTGDDFCMVTDEFILNYSEAHDNSHYFDRSLYPATPKS